MWKLSCELREESMNLQWISFLRLHAVRPQNAPLNTAMQISRGSMRINITQLTYPVSKWKAGRRSPARVTRNQFLRTKLSLLSARSPQTFLKIVAKTLWRGISWNYTGTVSTHPSFLFTGCSQVRLDRVQVDLWHCRFDIVDVEAAFKETRL